MNAVNRKKRGRIKGSKNASTRAKAMLSAYSDAAPEIDFGASSDREPKPGTGSETEEQ
jgi:hypothetical protein